MCPLSSFLIIFILDQTSTSFSKVWFQLTFFLSHLFRFFGEDHEPITHYYMQVYADPNLNLSTFQFKYYLFLTN